MRLERVTEMEACALLVSFVQGMQYYARSGSDIANIVESTLRPLNMPEDTGWSLPPAGACVAALISEAKAAGCGARSVADRAVASQLLIDPESAWEAVTQLSVGNALRVYAGEVVTFNLDPDAYQLVEVERFPPPHGLKATCGAQLHWMKDKSHADRWNWWRMLHSYPRVIDGYRCSTPEDVATLRAGQRFMLGVVRHPQRACSLHGQVDARGYEEAVQIAYALARDTRPWNRTDARQTLLRMRGKQMEALDPVGALAWSLLAQPITWQSPFPQVQNGQHRLCAARVHGVQRVLAVVS